MSARNHYNPEPGEYTPKLIDPCAQYLYRVIDGITEFQAFAYALSSRELASALATILGSKRAYADKPHYQEFLTACEQFLIAEWEDENNDD